MEDDKELQKPVLPRDIFRSERTFDIYEISALRLPWVVSSLSLGLGYIAAKNVIVTCNDISFSLSGDFAIPLFAIVILFPFLYLVDMRRRLDITPLVQQVLEINPGTDIQRWEKVAYRSNLILYQQRLWNTPYRFFNGEHAQCLFSQRVLRPYFKGNFDDITDTDKIQSACDYLQSLDEQFEMSLKDDLPQLPLSAELPRDTQKSFFFFFQCLRVIDKIALCCFQGFAFYKLLLACFEAGIMFAVKFALYLFFQYGVCSCCRDGMRSIYPELGIMQAINFLAIITKVNPRKELDTWDQIAMFMNGYLMEEDGGYSKNIFFDGKHCLNFYEIKFESLSVHDCTNNFIDLKEIVKVVQSKRE